MTALAAVPLLRIPPFPNAAVGQLIRTAGDGARALSDGEIEDIAAALAEAKVGGTYWAAQPPLPDAPYTLLRIADPDVRARAIAAIDSRRPILLWSDEGSKPPLQPSHCVSVVEGPADPWHLLGGAANVVVEANDELALLAALAGVALTSTGDGRFEQLEHGGAPALRDALRRHLVDGDSFTDPFTGQIMDLKDAIALCAFWRTLIDTNRNLTAAIGFAFWKQPTVAPLLWGGSSPVPFVSRPRSIASDGHIAVWKSRSDPATLAKLQASDARMVEVEDGFIRSAGLGADCVPPLSIIADSQGVYFDPARPSDLENLIQNGDFTPQLIDRAQRLRALIVATGISKYGSGSSPLERRDSGRRHLLVPGQVEDDRSVLCGGGAVTTNLELLRRVRDSNPDCFIIYKPHPDVEAGHRTGLVADHDCAALADEVVRSAPISALIDLVDEVHVNTSLAGFEALLREKPVTTHGVPFYAGWGLSSDLGAVPPRRSARRSLDELVAAALLLYPRYLDPVTGLPCPPEVLIRRLSEGGVGQADGPVVWLRRLQGRANRAVSRMWSR